MKLIKNTAFWAIFFALLFLLSAIVSPKNNTTKAGVVGRDSRAAGILAEPEESLDMIFLGDSECLTSVAPLKLWENYGITSYVCGQTGQRAVESYYWLRDIFEKQSPQLVVLETNLLYRYDGFYKELDKCMLETAGYYIPFLQYHNRWKTLTGRDLKFEFSHTGRIVTKGFEAKEGVVPYTLGEYMKETEEVQEIEGIVQYYLEKIKELCEENGASLLLMGVPSPVNWTYEKHNGVTTFSDEHDVPYLDMNLMAEEVGIDWEQDSFDGGDHLNYSGAMKVTSYLGNYLKEHYVLEDHRGQVQYKTWTEDLKVYKKMVSERRKGAINGKH